MAISGTPTGTGNDLVTVSPTGWHTVDGKDGSDTLRVQYGALTGDVDMYYTGYGWWRVTDEFSSAVDFINFEALDVTSGSGDDYIRGWTGNDTLTAGAGDDILEAGGGVDVLRGGTGIDRAILDFRGSGVSHSLTLDPTSTVTVGGNGTTLAGIENLQIWTDIGNDLIDSRLGQGNDILETGDGNDTFMSRSGHDSFNAGNGTDLLVVDFSAATTAVSTTYTGYGWNRLADKAGVNSVDYYSVERFNLTGGTRNDTLLGGELNDTLVGRGGNDWLNGGKGGDNIEGGTGIDTWQVDLSDRTVKTNVNLQNQSTNVGATLKGVEALHLTGGAAEDYAKAKSGRFNDWFSTGEGNDTVVTGLGVDSANGGNGDKDLLVMNWSGITDPAHDIFQSYEGYGWNRFKAASGDMLDYYGFERFDLTGGAGHDNLIGGALGDKLKGNGGNDTLNGGTGNDTVNGGAGNDLWIADTTAKSANMFFSAAKSQTTAQLANRGMNVTKIEAVNLKTGAGADTINTAGFSLSDVIESGAGRDKINSGLGFDTLNGQDGVDTLILNYDGLTSDISTTYLGYNWNRYGDADGTTHADYINFERFNITGGKGNDALVGGDDIDRLIGKGGNDVLNGGAGQDYISGGTGNDTWIANYGTETTGMAFTLSTLGNGTLTHIGTKVFGVENVQITTGQANDSIDLSRMSGNDIVNTGDGDDVVNLGRGTDDEANGGLGTDTLIADMSDATSGLRMSYAGYGWEKVEARNGSYVLDFVNFEHVNLTGGNRNDRLYGFGDTDTLVGGNGRDILEGKGGNDVLTGGNGADMFLFKTPTSDGIDRITDGAAGDMLRIAGSSLTGGVTAGSGANVGQGDVQLATAGGVTTLYVGLDATAGYDFAVQLDGTFATSDFSLGGTDILLI
ncbi:hypothetical protein NBRC116590_21830 [Pelagimonas sp. KU-00592-HH]|uniref:beta strand repeat-containing protein n=1 Tax=Pelagimonas sp. KU-00592-HH TaxID=3127651 RepID=UPI003106DDF3